MGTRPRRRHHSGLWRLPLVALLAVPALAACGPATPPVPATAPVTVAPTTTPAPTSSAPVTSAPTAAPTTTEPTTTSPTPTTSLPPGASTIPIAEPDGRTPPHCPTSQLSVTLGRGEGSAGSVYRSLVFTNTGSTTCRLRGHPGVVHVAGDDGHQVGRAAQDVGPSAGEVDLDPRESAHAVLRASNTGNHPEDTCRPTETRGYRVRPPGGTAAAYVPSPGIGCAGDVTGLQVQAMKPGRGPGDDGSAEDTAVDDPGPPPPNCTTVALSVGLGDIEGEAAGYFRPIVFTNTGDSRCALRGYPGVEYVAGDDGHQVGVPAEEVGPLRRRVDLEPGDSAHARLQVADAEVYSDDACRPTHARGLRIYPPDEDAAAYVPAPETTCAEDIPILQILTIRPGKA